jgi:hypothetical protein
MKTLFSVRTIMSVACLSMLLVSCNDPVSQDESMNAPKESGNQHARSASDDLYAIDKSEMLKLELPVTKEMQDAVVEIVRPVKEVVEKLLNDDKTGTYQAYKEDAERLVKLEDAKEIQALTKEIQQKYFEFFKEVWTKADVDEAGYQQKIKDVFPKEIQETIAFDEFLTFSMHKKKHTRDNEPSPAPPAPAPENICFDPTTTFFGIRYKEKNGLANAENYVYSNRIESWAVGEFAGLGKATTGYASNITIPGTFPDDDRLLRVKKTFQWKGYCTAISVIGMSFASVYYTTVATEEYLRLWAPITWVSTKTFDEPKMEEYLINKRFMYNIRYGVSTYADGFGEIGALATASSEADDIMWSVCEE